MPNPQRNYLSTNSDRAAGLVPIQPSGIFRGDFVTPNIENHPLPNVTTFRADAAPGAGATDLCRSHCRWAYGPPYAHVL